MDPAIVITLSTVLCVLLAAAALHKLLGRSAFAAALADYRILPAFVVPVAANGLALLELAAAALLLSGSQRALGAGLAAGLFSLYALAMTVNLVRGRAGMACGCEWSTGQDAGGEPLSSGLVLRNLGLVAIAGTLGLVVVGREPTWADHLNGAAGGVVLALVWATADRLRANRRVISIRRTS